MLEIVGRTSMFLWLALPLLAFAAHARRRRPLHPFLLFALTVVVGFLLLAAGAWASEAWLEAEKNRFDLDGDGGFDVSELTPEAQRALDAWASDTGRTMVLVTGIPLSALWTAICFSCLFTGKWLVSNMMGPRPPLVGPPASAASPGRGDGLPEPTGTS
jgi:hypothetical protein